jgi:hypothetical protein
LQALRKYAQKASLHFNLNKEYKACVAVLKTGASFIFFKVIFDVQNGYNTKQCFVAIFEMRK